MPDAQHAVDQVEFQLLHTGQLAQLVLDQRLLGGAIHRLDTEAAQTTTRCRRFAKGHYSGLCIAGAARMGMLHGLLLVRVLVVIMVMIVVMCGGILDRRAHSLWLQDSACCQVNTL